MQKKKQKLRTTCFIKILAFVPDTESGTILYKEALVECGAEFDTTIELTNHIIAKHPEQYQCLKLQQIARDINALRRYVQIEFFGKGKK